MQPDLLRQPNKPTNYTPPWRCTWRLRIFVEALRPLPLKLEPYRPNDKWCRVASDFHLFDIVVETNDIDFMGHANNAVYLNWVQEATLDHWRTFAPKESVDAFVWVAVKHEITYRKPAFLSDSLTVYVQLDRVQRESAFYDVLIKRGGTVLAEVKSRWCCIDAETRMPVRLSKELVDKFVGQVV
ncbi:MAG: acyl-CoA thioesterase [Micrococcales bacterium]